MLNVNFNRRDFIKVGAIGGGLSYIPFSDAAFAQEEMVSSDKSVVWVWLGGGPTQFETFHAPTETVPDPYRPVTGMVRHSNGLAFGGFMKQSVIMPWDYLVKTFLVHKGRC